MNSTVFESVHVCDDLVSRIERSVSSANSSL